MEFIGRLTQAGNIKALIKPRQRGRLRTGPAAAPMGSARQQKRGPNQVFLSRFWFLFRAFLPSRAGSCRDSAALLHTHMSRGTSRCFSLPHRSTRRHGIPARKAQPSHLTQRDGGPAATPHSAVTWMVLCSGVLAGVLGMVRCSSPSLMEALMPAGGDRVGKGRAGQQQAGGRQAGLAGQCGRGSWLNRSDSRSPARQGAGTLEGTPSRPHRRFTKPAVQQGSGSTRHSSSAGGGGPSSPSFSLPPHPPSRRCRGGGSGGGRSRRSAPRGGSLPPRSPPSPRSFVPRTARARCRG